MNTVKFEVYNKKNKTFIDYSAFLTLPYKFADLLDEQLDEAKVELIGLPKAYVHPITNETIETAEVFNPFTLCRITISTSPECVLSTELNALIDKNANNSNYFAELSKETKKRSEQRTLFFYVANDSSLEKPIGSGQYNHTLYLIELTKIAERFIGDNLTFTNSLGDNYVVDSYARCDYTYDRQKGSDTSNKSGSFYSTVIKNVYKPKVMFLTPDKLKKQEKNLPIDFPAYQNGTNTQGFYIKDRNGYYVTQNNYTVELSEGTYTAYYTYHAVETAGVTLYKDDLELKYTFAIVKNHLPLKKWTITDVINRLFDTVEPLRYESTTETQDLPRFTLAAKTAEKLDKIIAPEFAFTSETLRESLQQIGGYIHGEPRITGFVDDSNYTRFVVDFDFYGDNIRSNISKLSPITTMLKTDVNQFCTALDSPTQNLTNTLDWSQNVLSDPYNDGYITLRTENTTARLSEDDSTFIPTSKGIANFGAKKNLLVKYDGNIYDITQYVFESTDYNTLSSYEGSYPFCKAYGLYYTLNEPNIYGLFFKNPSAVSPIFQEYAIVNILRIVTGDDKLDLSGAEIMQLEFCVTYLPIYNARIKTHKQYVSGDVSTTLAYNQSANLIESRYYSEHLRGVVERLGNVEKTYTYNLTFLSQIPEIGTKFDSNYYISNVNVEIYKAYLKCTVALSKNFNRRSEYVGINSQKRMWEISEKEATKRETNVNTFVVVTENTLVEMDVKPTQQTTAFKYIAYTLFNKRESSQEPISFAAIHPKNSDFENLQTKALILPVVSGAFNTSLVFTFDFTDNYAAGQKLAITSSENGGYWSEYVPYTDYYGRIYYLEYSLCNDEITADSNALPLYDGENDSSGEVFSECILYRKDNKEIPQISTQITVVSDSEDIIIGTALCRNCSLVNVAPKGYKLYAFKENLNPLEGKILNLSEMLKDGSAVEVEEQLPFVYPTSVVIPAIGSEYKAWALVTDITETTIDVSDESGKNETTQKITDGGEILLGKNNQTPNEVCTLYFKPKNKIN